MDSKSTGPARCRSHEGALAPRCCAHRAALRIMPYVLRCGARLVVSLAQPAGFGGWRPRPDRARQGSRAGAGRRAPAAPSPHRRASPRRQSIHGVFCHTSGPLTALKGPRRGLQPPADAHPASPALLGEPTTPLECGGTRLQAARASGLHSGLCSERWRAAQRAAQRARTASHDTAAQQLRVPQPPRTAATLRRSRRMGGSR